MSCNNYDVTDLGVMVPAEQIVKKACEENVDMIGLSGLITPSLEEMVNVAKEMERAGLRLPIMVGGATTSEMHVALKIAPVYSGIVVWVKDAAQNPIVAQRLMNDGERMAYEAELKGRYARLREEYAAHQQKLHRSVRRVTTSLTCLDRVVRQQPGRLVGKKYEFDNTYIK